MPAYMIAMTKVFDAEGLAEGYGKAVLPLIKKFGGRYIVRGGRPELFEGELDPRRTIIVEFPTMEALRAFWYRANTPKLRNCARASPNSTSGQCRAATWPDAA